MHPLAKTPEPPLSKREEMLLADLESVIEANMNGFVLAGSALAKIRDQRLYRIQYPTFEEYLLRVWDMARATAYQLMEAAEVHDNLKKTFQDNDGAQGSFVRHGGQNEVILPRNERQARPLTSLPPDKQKEVWKTVVDKANDTGAKITANLVIQVANDAKREETGGKIQGNKDRARKAVHIPEAMQQSYMSLLQSVIDQNESGWDAVSKRTVMDLLKDLLSALEE